MGRKIRGEGRKMQSAAQYHNLQQQEQIQEAFNNPDTEFASEFSLAERNRKSELERDK